MASRWPRTNVCGISTYTLLGMGGYLVAIAVGLHYARTWTLSTADRLAMFIAPSCAFLIVVAFSTAIARYERIVFYETSVAAVGVVTIIGHVADLATERVVDITTIGIGIFLSFGRLGCLSVACCHGTPGRGVTYGDAHVKEGFWSRWNERALWPIQGIEALASAALVAVAWQYQDVPGQAASIYIVGYAAVRYPLELARGDAVRPYFLGVSEAQWFAVATVGIVAWQQPSWIVFSMLGGLIAATIALVASRHARAFIQPAHLRELDRVMGGLVDGATRETSLGVAVSRHVLEDGRFDWILSSSRPAWSLRVASKIAKQLWQRSEIVEGRRAGVIHILVAR